MTVGIVAMPGDANAATIQTMLSCTNPYWAQENPHRAMQVHIECTVGVCVAKSVAYETLHQQGKLVPDSGRVS